MCNAARLLQRLNRYGITSCQSDDYETFPGVPYKTVQKLLRTPGLMTVRVNEQAQFTNVEALSAYIESGDAYFEDDMFRAGPLKIISDGSLGARTACLSRRMRTMRTHAAFRYTRMRN